MQNWLSLRSSKKLIWLLIILQLIAIIPLLSCGSGVDSSSKSGNGEIFYGETPYGETPYGETPNEETPNGEIPYGETPNGETPNEETPSSSATLTWDAPTTNADGTTLTDLAGYKIYYGTSSGSYTEAIDVGNVTTYKIDNLTPGTYYFAVTAYDTSGTESDYSNEASKTIK